MANTRNHNSNRERIKRVCACAVCAALICLLSPLAIPGEIPFTLSLFVILLTGGVLKPLDAVAATLCYIALGAAGLPVFSGFRGGVGVLLGPTGGFIFAYPLMALCVSLVARKINKNGFLKLLGGGLAAVVICHAGGVAWYCFTTGSPLGAALAVVSLRFIPFDVLKALLAALLALRIRKAVFGVE